LGCYRLEFYIGSWEEGTPSIIPGAKADAISAQGRLQCAGDVLLDPHDAERWMMPVRRGGDIHPNGQNKIT